MRKGTKIVLIAAACLVVTGLALFAIVMTGYDWDFSRLSTVKYVTDTIEIEEDFQNIHFNSETADIVFAVSEDGKCRVVCTEHEHTNHAASVDGNTLTVTEEDHRKWYEHIGFDLGSNEITLYLPKTQYASLSVRESTGDIEIPGEFSFDNTQIKLSTGDVRYFASNTADVSIKLTTGDILVKNTSAASLDLSSTTGDITVSNVAVTNELRTKVSTGDVKLTNCTCKALTSDGTTGDLTLNNVIAKEKLTVKRSTGDVKLTQSDAGELLIETSTGDVTGSLLSEKVFITKTDTGDVNVPKSISGGRCEITTDTGDIKFSE